MLVSPIRWIPCEFQNIISAHVQTSIFTEASKVGSEVHIDIWDSTGRWIFLSTRVRSKLPPIALCVDSLQIPGRHACRCSFYCVWNSVEDDGWCLVGNGQDN